MGTIESLLNKRPNLYNILEKILNEKNLFENPPFSLIKEMSKIITKTLSVLLLENYKNENDNSCTVQYKNTAQHLGRALLEHFTCDCLQKINIIESNILSEDVIKQKLIEMYNTFKKPFTKETFETTFGVLFKNKDDPQTKGLVKFLLYF